MPAVIQVKRGTASSWTSANTVLAAGEIGFETDTKKMKVGDGSTAWTSLGYTATDGGTAQTTYATGDLLYASAADTLAKRTVGSTGQVLTVSGGLPTWATPSAVGNFTHIYASGSTTAFPNSTDTKVIWTTENYDTLNEFASSRFTATTAGYYLVNAGVGTDPQALGPNTVFETSIFKNGSKAVKGAVYSAFNVTGRLSARCSAVISLAVNDYIEIYFNQNATATTTGNADGPQTFLTIDRIVS